MPAVGRTVDDALPQQGGDRTATGESLDHRQSRHADDEERGRQRGGDQTPPTAVNKSRAPMPVQGT
jgi:hypothetical protein